MEPQYKIRNFWSLESFFRVAKNFELFARLIHWCWLWIRKCLQWAIDFNRALWVLPKDIDQRLQQANEERRELNSHPSLWLK